MTQKNLAERVTAIETRCPLREELVNEQFNNFNLKLDHVVAVLDKHTSALENLMQNGIRTMVLEHEKEITEINDRIRKVIESDRHPEMRTRATDLRNKPPLKKAGIVIAAISLVLGNMAMIGFVLTKIGEALISIGQ